MKKMNTIIVLTLAALSVMASSAWAQEKATLRVAGLVCSFCAQGIQKRFQQTGVVKAVNVDLDKHEVSLEFRENESLTDAEIRSLLKSAGYNLLEVERTPKNKEIKE